jgi:arabinose-5-phosphate isomerase
LIESGTDFYNTIAEKIMISDPITIEPNMSAMRALEILEENNITQLIVTDSSGVFLGIVHIHDLLNKGLTT